MYCLTDISRYGTPAKCSSRYFYEELTGGNTIRETIIVPRPSLAKLHAKNRKTPPKYLTRLIYAMPENLRRFSEIGGRDSNGYIAPRICNHSLGTNETPFRGNCKCGVFGKNRTFMCLTYSTNRRSGKFAVSLK